MKKAIAARRILFAVAAALAVVLGSTGAAVASTSSPAVHADSSDVVSIYPTGDQFSDQTDSADLGAPQAESSEGYPITGWTATGLPPGLSVNPGTGEITGTIPVSAPPVIYTVDLTAADSIGTKGSETFTWTVSDPTVVTNPGDQSSALNAPVSLRIYGSDYRASVNFTATGLPPGLTINEYTGVISGAATAAGAYPVTVTVTEPVSGTSAQASFTWYANSSEVVSIDPIGDQSSYPTALADLVPQAESSEGYLITGWTATGLPAGLSVNPGTGEITGTIPVSAPPANYTVDLTATDSIGTKGSEAFTWTVLAADTISVTSPGSQSTSIGVPASLQIHASSSGSLPLSYTATGLPPGLSISRPGHITGTPAGPARSYTPTVTVTDGMASHSVTFTWTIKPAAVTYSGIIRLTKMGYCLDDRNNSNSNGAVVQIWRCTRGTSQVWQVMSDGTIRHNGRCLETPGTGNGTKVELWTCGTGKSNQQWNTRNSRVTNPSSGKVLNDPGYGGNGTEQVLWSNTGTINEIWAMP